MTSTCVSFQHHPQCPAPTATSNPTVPLCILFYQLNRTYLEYSMYKTLTSTGTCSGTRANWLPWLPRFTAADLGTPVLPKGWACSFDIQLHVWKTRATPLQCCVEQDRHYSETACNHRFYGLTRWSAPSLDTPLH